MISGAITHKLAELDAGIERMRSYTDEIRKELAGPDPKVIIGGEVSMVGDEARRFLQTIVDTQEKLEALAAEYRKRNAH